MLDIALKNRKHTVDFKNEILIIRLTSRNSQKTLFIQLSILIELLEAERNNTILITLKTLIYMIFSIWVYWSILQLD